jgi:hypothetical protein
VRALLAAAEHIINQVEAAINRHSAGAFFTASSRT